MRPVAAGADGDAAAGFAAGGTGRGRAAAVTDRRLSLARAELTLLLRNRTALFFTFAVPGLFTVAARGAVADLDLSGTGLSTGTVLVPASFGFVLLLAVYATLVLTYTARREERVLQRLRAGEPGAAEILLGAALPALALAVAQTALLAVAGTAAFHLAAPAAPVLLAAGLLSGLALTAVAAAATSTVTRSAESAQVTALPLVLVSFVGSEVFVPLAGWSATAREVCAWLPMSPVMELLRGGWTGDLGAGGAVRALAVAWAWTALAAWTVRAGFRWEPRR
ncbi:ABC transporter permease [Streptomyces phytohabitans]|uniref:ABC transporter permease n=1 Tax=Streptomyces phytohabitans TaxID=1150371 RepID=UPI00345C390E